jgi:hypothetical protein
LCALFEFLRKGLVVEEDPGVIEFAIPGPLQVFHRRNKIVQLFITDEGNESSVRAGGMGAVGGIVVAIGSP